MDDLFSGSGVYPTEEEAEEDGARLALTFLESYLSFVKDNGFCVVYTLFAQGNLSIGF